MAELIKNVSRFLQSIIFLAVSSECLSKVQENGNSVSIWRDSLSATFHVVLFVVFSQGQGEASARGTTMEGDCLSCIKYLMFVFNFLIFVSTFFFFISLSKTLHLAISEVSVNLMI